MIISNEHVKEVTVEIPEGHRHVRTTMVFMDGAEFTFQEATIANLVRAYITVKTHPAKDRVTLKGERLAQRKDGYAEWQLLEEETTKR
jgi:phage baseplate assembly protein gpV